MSQSQFPVQFVDFDNDEPVKVTCPSCEETVLTRVEKKKGPRAWMSCFFLVATGWICGCCLIPFYIKDLLEFKHFCPKCKALVGKSRGGCV